MLAELAFYLPLSMWKGINNIFSKVRFEPLIGIGGKVFHFPGSSTVRHIHSLEFERSEE